MAEKNPYIGKIKNSGTQTVKVNPDAGGSGKASVKTGTDLRSGK